MGSIFSRQQIHLYINRDTFQPTVEDFPQTNLQNDVPAVSWQGRGLPCSLGAIHTRLRSEVRQLAEREDPAFLSHWTEGFHGMLDYNP
jgi:hypothetical protein